MTEMVARLDDYGRPAWIAVMVLGFIVFWPIGLAILAYMIWSGRMTCGTHGDMARWQQRMADKWGRKVERFGMQGRPTRRPATAPSTSTGRRRCGAWRRRRASSATLCSG